MVPMSASCGFLTSGFPSLGWLPSGEGQMVTEVLTVASPPVCLAWDCFKALSKL